MKAKDKNRLAKQKYLIYFLLIVITFLSGFYLRLRPALLRPVIFDEAFTITYLAEFDHLEQIIFADASVPPLHYLLIKLMSQISTDILWLRMPSVIFSMLGLYLAYQLGRKFSKKVALLSTIMLSFSTLQLLFAWQAYVYGQLFFLGMMSVYLFFELLTNKATKHENLKAVLFILCSVMAFLTHYGFVWTIVGFAIILLQKIIISKFNWQAIAKQHQKLIFANISIGLFIICYLPVLIFNLKQALLNINWFDPINIYTIGQSFGRLLGFYDQFDWNIFLDSNISKILFTIILVFLTTYALKLKKEKVNFLLIISLSNLLTPITLSLLFDHNIHAVRAIIVSSATFILLFAICVTELLRDKWLNIFLIVFIAFYLYFFSITNRNIHAFSQEFDLIKQYVLWFRKHPSRVKNQVNLLVYNKNHSMQTPGNWVNYFVLNYYWQGYDGQEPLPAYQKIRKATDIQQKKFYLLETNQIKNENDLNTFCPNYKRIQVTQFEKRAQQSTDLYYYDALDTYIYECNPDK